MIRNIEDDDEVRRLYLEDWLGTAATMSADFMKEDICYAGDLCCANG
jgi:hypothetical protein